MTQETSEPSLYERLGGIYPIAAVVDDFIDRIMVDPRLNANPLVDEAHHRVSKAGSAGRHRGRGRPIASRLSTSRT
jgi:hemoglobin